MKRILLALSLFALTNAIFAQKKMADVAKFKTETIEFGKVKQGVPAEGVFIIKNISSEPLLIEQANPTCGCTIADYTKTPIAPGKTGEIKAKYNAANSGAFDKHLTVKFAGIDEVKQITLKGEVIAAEVYDKEKLGSGDKAAEKEKLAAASNTTTPSNVKAAKPAAVKPVASKKANKEK